MQLVDEQRAVAERVINEPYGFVVEAPPGAGKTKLIEYVLKKSKTPILACMFSRNAKNNLANRLNEIGDKNLISRHEVVTLDSLAANYVLRNFQSIGFERTPTFTADKGDDRPTAEHHFELTLFEKMRLRHEITYGWARYFFLAALREGRAFLNYEKVIVDEYQDLNPLDLALILAIAQQNPVIFFGDRDQAINGFRKAVPYAPIYGASETLRLTYSFRVPRKIAEYASLITGNPFTGRPGGKVFKHTYRSNAERTELIDRLIKCYSHADVAVLMRSNRTVEELSTHLRSQRITVAGNYETPLTQFWKHESVSWATRLLKAPTENWVSAASYLGFPLDIDALQHRRWSAFSDDQLVKLRALHETIRDCRRNPCLRDSLDAIREHLVNLPLTWSDYLDSFTNELGKITSVDELEQLQTLRTQKTKVQEGLTVRSIYSSKGSEWPIIIADTSLLANEDWQKEGKMTAYVAATRAQEELHLLVPLHSRAWPTTTFNFDG